MQRRPAVPRAAAVRLLLVGGGHAHLEILRRLILSPRRWLGLTLVSSSPMHHYSGMVPGYLAGAYREEEISFDLQQLTERAGGEFYCGEAVRVVPHRQLVVVADGSSFRYDLASFNIGSRTVGGASPNVREHAQLVKPISKAVQLRKRLTGLAADSRRAQIHVLVVGGGAAGVETACACSTVLDEAGRRRRIAVLDAGPEILPEYTRRFRATARRLLERRRIAVETGCRASAVEDAGVRLEDGSIRPSDLTVWLTGAAAHPIFEASGLAVSKDGFLLVDDGLRSISDPRIFGAGDCATLINHPATPKAGVYAVRQAPLLWQNLMASFQGSEGPLYTPQKKFLSILNSADGKALLYWKGLVSHSRWAWLLKDWIDRRFVRKYQELLGQTRTP